MRRSKRPLGSITKPAASLNVARSLATGPAIGSIDRRGRAQGVHCGARERGGVASGGAGAARRGESDSARTRTFDACFAAGNPQRVSGCIPIATFHNNLSDAPIAT
jgi:hypothetical protein